MGRKIEPLPGSKLNEILSAILEKYNTKYINTAALRLSLSPQQLSQCLLGFMAISKGIERKLLKVLSKSQISFLNKRNRILTDISNELSIGPVMLALINDIIQEDNLGNIPLITIAECMEGSKTRKEIRKILLSSQN